METRYIEILPANSGIDSLPFTMRITKARVSFFFSFLKTFYRDLIKPISLSAFYGKIG